MTDLDTLREALQAPAEAGDPPDIAALIKRGRRLRRLRRLTAVAGAACAAAAVFGAVTGITHLTRPATAPAHYPAAPARPMPAPSRGHAPGQPLPSRAPAPLATPSPSPSRTAPSRPTGSPSAVSTLLPPSSSASQPASNPTAAPDPTHLVPAFRRRRRHPTLREPDRDAQMKRTNAAFSRP